MSNKQPEGEFSKEQNSTFFEKLSEESSIDLHAIQSIITANPLWNKRIGALCIDEGLETAIDLFTALLSQVRKIVRQLNPDILSTEIPDDLGNGRVFQIHGKVSSDPRTLAQLDRLFTTILESLCSAHLDLLEHNRRLFTKQTEFKIKQLRKGENPEE